MMWRVIVARSRACVVVVALAGGLLVYGCIKVYSVSCGVGVVVYICIYIMRLWLVWWWWWSACAYMDRYI